MRYAAEHLQLKDIREMKDVTKRFKALSSLEKRMKDKGRETGYITELREETERELLQIRKGR